MVKKEQMLYPSLHLSSSSSLSSPLFLLLLMSSLVVVIGWFPCMGVAMMMNESSSSAQFKPAMMMNESSSSAQFKPALTTTTETHEKVSDQKKSQPIMRGLGSTMKELKIAVPDRKDFQEFVTWSLDSQNRTIFKGYSIEVFEKAVKELPYELNYSFKIYKDGAPNLVYDNMITALSNGEYDAVVGDVTIRSYRIDKVDFTQPYLESGLVVVAPVTNHKFSETWAFLRPFTVSMWIATGVFLLFTGLVVWILEHKENSHFRGPPREQATTVFWFICSTMFFAHREKIKSALGRVVVIVWLFVVLIIVSSYTANLTSILMVQNLSPSIDGINSLKRSSSRIGYQTGSYVSDYLVNDLHIAKERLVNFSKIEEYTRALNLGPNDPRGVAAIVAERPYMQVFLSEECGFAIAGQEFTISGFGYAFPKGSKLARDISVAILQLSENGTLQEIYDKWLNMVECNSELQSNRLGLESFKGLFIITGITSGVCMFIYFVGSMIGFWTNYKKSLSSGQLHEEDGSSTGLKVLRSFASYMDESVPPREPGSRNKRSSRATPGLNVQTPPPEASNDIPFRTQLGKHRNGSDDIC